MKYHGRQHHIVVCMLAFHFELFTFNFSLRTLLQTPDLILLLLLDYETIRFRTERSSPPMRAITNN